MLKSRGAVLAGLMLVTAVMATSQAMAQRYESPNYTIDASVGNSLGGDTESAGYKMVSSGGESIIGSGAGGSYLLDAGYVAQLVDDPYIELAVGGPVDLGVVTPGIPVVAGTTVTIDTNTNAYSLYISLPDGLESTSSQIPPLGATISSPIAWVDGTTKGLGFTVADAPAIDPKWQNGTRYSGIPTADEVVYSQSLGGAIGQEVVDVGFRLDVTDLQLAESYSGLLNFTATTTP